MASNAVVANPFVTEQSRQLKQSTASADVAVQRELAEVQAAVLMARRFPRDPVQAMDRILTACTRVSLAEGALYSYSRGGTDITGPSIRLAEAMAQAWSNLAFGIRELEQRSGESTMEAYCWDMETNVRQSRVFQVRHERHTRERAYKLTDPRDIYEQNANQGARRLRACILGVIPGDVVETAVEQCEATLKAEADISPEGLQKLVEAFGQFSVTREQLEVRCQRRLDAIRPAQVVQLRKIWASLRDEMSVPGDWFEMPQAQSSTPPPTGTEALRQRLAPKPERSSHGAGAPPAAAQERDPVPDVSEQLVHEDTSSAASTEAAGTNPATPVSPPDSPPEGGGEELVPASSPEGDIPIVKPARGPRGRGWDWPKYADELIKLATTLPRDRMGEFRVANASMINSLRLSDKEEWSRVQQELALYERGGEDEPC